MHASYIYPLTIRRINYTKSRRGLGAVVVVWYDDFGGPEGWFRDAPLFIVSVDTLE